MDGVKISCGVRYIDIGDTNALKVPPGFGVSHSTFAMNSAVAVVLKIGHTF